MNLRFPKAPVLCGWIIALSLLHLLRWTSCCWNCVLLLSNETNVQLPYLIQLQEIHFLQMP